MEKEPILYFIGMGQTKNGDLVRIFYGQPHKRYGEDKEQISILIGPPGIECNGPMLAPLEMLNYIWRSWIRETVDGVEYVRGIKEEPPGWFVRKCEEANCSWFVEYVKRMAGGEKIPLETIKSAYFAHNQKEITSVIYGSSSMPYAVIS